MLPLAQEKLKELLEYNPVSGDFYWKVNRGNARAGDKAGTIKVVKDAWSCISIMVSGKHYLAHRLAWFYIYGEWPDTDIDHKDGNSLNNAFLNLRLATGEQNSYNMVRSKANKSGVKGVYWNKREKKWVASICAAGRRMHLGYFKELDAAEAVVAEARGRFHGEFARG